MRMLITFFALSLAACGGTEGKLPDFAAGTSSCPSDLTSVRDGDACGTEDSQCNTCVPTCEQSCSELFCQNGAWLHVLERALCDLGDRD